MTLTLHSDNAEKNYVIYAWAVDKAGNASSYICSEGIVQDTKIPSGVFDSPDQKAETLKDTEGTFKITMEEDATLLYFYVQEGDFESKKDYDLFVKKVADYIHDNFDNKANSASGQRLPFAVKEEGKWKPIISQSNQRCHTDQTGLYPTVKSRREQPYHHGVTASKGMYHLGYDHRQSRKYGFYIH